MRVNEYYENGEIDIQKHNFNKWVLAVGDGTVPAKKKEGEDEATWIEIPERNDNAEAIHAYMFKKLGGDSVTYNSADEICKASTDTLDQHNLYPVEFLNTLNFPCMPLHSLCLKKDLPIMLLRNVNPSKGLCNGIRLIIMDLGHVTQ
ncbi:ATP-dependent DNA helicase PIF1-like protein [Tanacetum coccineum]